MNSEPQKWHECFLPRSIRTLVEWDRDTIAAADAEPGRSQTRKGDPGSRLGGM